MHVSISAILAKYRESLDRARALLDALLAGPLPDEEPAIRTALQHAMLTPDDALGDAQREWLAVLRR
jgi:5'-methylthioadenosine phosphorylase